ncbi:GNAT family N-acetyltransferase [Ferrimonas pelagia]|uniref:N-acetyltransferase domain-containing protein n=1 Tax=Ferrimonas pelagia TaxID=1177826 RepID=A0ABP9FHQ7_9GAMM
MPILQLQLVSEAEHTVYDNLSQAYEAEFSSLTGRMPDKLGRLSKDTELGGRVRGYLWLQDGVPIGMAAVDRQDHHSEVCDFYIIPSARRGALGRAFAHALFDQRRGEWLSKQIAGAEHAVHFWRRAISSYSQSDFREDPYRDRYWGIVTRMRFTTSKPVTEPSYGLLGEGNKR